MDALLNLAAALAYAIGGVFMKSAQGFARPVPSVMLFVCFGLGATLQTLSLVRQDLGAGYTIVLGLEAVSAFVLGAVIFREPVTATRVVAVALVGVGVYLLRR